MKFKYNKMRYYVEKGSLDLVTLSGLSLDPVLDPFKDSPLS